jgi:hypothetical protein
MIPVALEQLGQWLTFEIDVPAGTVQKVYITPCNPGVETVEFFTTLIDEVRHGDINKSVVFSEFGYSDYGTGLSEQQVAEYLNATFVFAENSLQPWLEAIYWFRLIDPDPNFDKNLTQCEYGFGLMKSPSQNYALKQAAYTYAIIEEYRSKLLLVVIIITTPALALSSFKFKWQKHLRVKRRMYHNIVNLSVWLYPILLVRFLDAYIRMPACARIEFLLLNGNRFKFGIKRQSETTYKSARAMFYASDGCFDMCGTFFQNLYKGITKKPYNEVRSNTRI